MALTAAKNTLFGPSPNNCRTLASVQHLLQPFYAAGAARTDASDGHVQAFGDFGVGGALRLEVERDQQLPAVLADLREAGTKPLGQLPVLYGIGIAPAEEHGALGYVRALEALARCLAPVALEQAPGVPSGDGGEPGAEAAVLGQAIEALDQDGEGDLRDVGGGVAGQPVSQRDGIDQALVLVQQ